MSPDERPTKQDAFLAFLKEGWVSVHLDARKPGVDVPPALASNPHLVLQYGQNMPLPIPDLEITDAGIKATLSFARTPHPTIVPWSAVYIVACTDGRGVLYYEDVPEEVSLMTSPVDGQTGRPIDLDTVVESVPSEGGPAPMSMSTSTSPRVLRSVPAAVNETGENDAPTLVPAEHHRRRRKPQLKLVK